MKDFSRKNKGITLVALVITVIILLILVGVTISNLGENGLIDKTKKSTDEYKISDILESLELEKTNLILDKEGNMPSVPEYIEYLKNKEIIATSDVDDIDEDSKNIIVDEYIFLIEKETNNNIKITYKGKLDDMPIIKEIEITAKSSDSISVKVTAVRANEGNYKYYIKNVTLEEASYTLIDTIKQEEYTFSRIISRK